MKQNCNRRECRDQLSCSREQDGLSADEGAVFLGIGRSTFYDLKKKDETFPKAAIIRGRRVYVKEHLHQWLLRQIRDDVPEARAASPQQIGRPGFGKTLVPNRRH